MGTTIRKSPCVPWLCKGTQFLLAFVFLTNHVHEQTSPYLLLGAQDQRLGTEQDQLPCGSTETSSGHCQDVKRRKLAWFGHVTRHASFSETNLQCTLEGGRRRGRQRKCWMDNIKEWTYLSKPELLTRASCRKVWKRISVESSLKSPHQDPIGQGTELNCSALLE